MSAESEGIEAFVEARKDSAVAAPVNPAAVSHLQGAISLAASGQPHGAVRMLRVILAMEGVPDTWRTNLTEAIRQFEFQHQAAAGRILYAVRDDRDTGEMTAKSRLPALVAQGRQLHAELKQAVDQVHYTTVRRSPW